MNSNEFGKSKTYLKQREADRENSKKQGAKRKRYDELTIHNQRKLLRNSGQEYINVSNKVVEEKKFQFISVCCSNNCHLKVSEDEQRELFEYFWNLADYYLQNLYLYGLLSKKIRPKTILSQIQNGNKRKPNFCRWDYHLDIDGVKANVCINLFISIFQVSPKRLSTLQNKINNGKSFSDGRGYHKHHKKIPKEKWYFLHQLINGLSKNNSHYSLEKSQKFYFEDNQITLTWLYKTFNNILLDNKLEIMSYWSFKKYYDENFNIGFSNPKSDVCDLCFEMTNIGVERLTEEQRIIFDKHLNDYNDYKSIKSSILSSDLSEKLVIEFDYGQNKPLPKLNKTSNYYSRCLWFFIFNVFIHSTKESFMYYFLEGQFKKGSNSVISFVYQTLKSINLLNYKEIILFSDNCPGQNKNSTVFKSFVLFANYFGLKLTHYYPIRGHSYCVCDRQFGLFTKKLKKIGVIEHPNYYIQVLNELHFKVSEVEIKNFEELVDNAFNTKLNIKIQSLKKIEYMSNGNVNCYIDYNSNPNSYDYSLKLTSNWTDLLEPDGKYFISNEKVKDLLTKLIPGLKDENQAFYKEHLKKFSIDNYKNRF